MLEGQASCKVDLHPAVFAGHPTSVQLHSSKAVNSIYVSLLQRSIQSTLNVQSLGLPCLESNFRHMPDTYALSGFLSGWLMLRMLPGRAPKHQVFRLPLQTFESFSYLDPMLTITWPVFVSARIFSVRIYVYMYRHTDTCSHIHLYAHLLVDLRMLPSIAVAFYSQRLQTPL